MTADSGRIRVLLIEHNRILLEGLSQLLSESPDMELAGAAGSGITGIALFKEKRPSVTVIDLELPDTPAVEVVRQIRLLDSRAPILILATYELDAAGAESIGSGASAVISKDQIASMLLPLIHSVLIRP